MLCLLLDQASACGTMFLLFLLLVLHLMSSYTKELKVVSVDAGTMFSYQTSSVLFF
jgi:hypothetical protein